MWRRVNSTLNEDKNTKSGHSGSQEQDTPEAELSTRVPYSIAMQATPSDTPPDVYRPI